MTQYDEADTLEATDEQLAMLRELGVAEAKLEDVSFADAEAWIEELRSLREDAGRIRGV